ncbi:Uncharacterised protein [Klebsiella variicola]|nr:hypothetical protein SM94_02603 [Klebsiella pneumoniae]CAH6148560.1 hypothetical protein AN2336V5_1949 [Klebsiella oxytoca]SCA05067.1 Uncharacterised protein [Klebsiella quasipneumoniae]SXE24810.1 Uncharacterised protein [Klebsiella variicola]SAV41503.1 Uncharacterised protein [Klebsiella pneumoniae]
MYSLSTPGQRPSLNTDQRLTNKWTMLITVSMILITLYSVSNICGEMRNWILLSSLCMRRLEKDHFVKPG